MRLFPGFFLLSTFLMIMFFVDLEVSSEQDNNYKVATS